VIEGTGPYPHITYATHAGAPLMGTRILVDQLGLPGDDTSDYVNPAWIAGPPVNYDTSTFTFGTLERARRVWLANSEGYITFGLPANGVTAGVTATTDGRAGVIAAGRGQETQLGAYDEVAGVFKFPARGQIDGAGNVQLGFFNVGTLVNQPTATGDVHISAGGSAAAALIDTRFTGGLGATGYTTGDVVLALKQLGLLAL